MHIPLAGWIFGEKSGPPALPHTPPCLLTLGAGALQRLLNPPDPRGDLISCLRVQFGRVGWFISQPLALRLAQKLVSLSALLTAHVVACCDTLIVELLAAVSGLCTQSK